MTDLSGLALKDRKFISYGQNNRLDQESNPLFMKTGGVHFSGNTLYTNLDQVPLHHDPSGNLLVTDPAMPYDSSTNSVVSILHEHHEIHEGDHFFICNFETLASGASANFAVTTPSTAKWAHMVFEVAGTNQTEFRIYEGTTASGGTATTPYNNNRNSATTSTLTVKKNPTVSASGTLLYAQSKGLTGATPAASSTTGVTERGREIILLSGTTYLFAIKSAGAGNIVSYCGEWYEHTNA